MTTKRVAIFISGRGSNMEALIKACSRDQTSPAQICLVLSNKAEAAGLGFAQNHGIATGVVVAKTFSERAAYEQEIQNLLSKNAIDLICLAGFMRILSPDFVEKWEHRILNIHPSLLPSFPGLDTHRRALEEGVKIHGCSVHFVTKDLDRGPIVMQAAVPVLDGDDEESLGQRVLSCEHKIYPLALRRVANNEVVLEGNCTRLSGKADKKSSALFYSMG